MPPVRGLWPDSHRPGELLTRGSFVRGGPVPVCAQDDRRAEGHRPLTNFGESARGFQLRLVLSRGRPSASHACPSVSRGVSLAVRGVLSLDQSTLPRIVLTRGRCSSVWQSAMTFC
jgi:hypothetical protein